LGGWKREKGRIGENFLQYYGKGGWYDYGGGVKLKLTGGLSGVGPFNEVLSRNCVRRRSVQQHKTNKENAKVPVLREVGDESEQL